ncbi:Uncharacterised protein [Metamycoplasma cloacale]|uniref:Uncharacterized protein n=1 Tax=Metamycoplasma cloacale TaxID=92401 RepID=A0A2Z4LM44_9BACT|nr:hypothetical protein [Metamycoplasma cloacale]AWX42809.1 hypothetical protein DK849_01890 [Metamycoplasma cloacale]VEU79372.1 Uncharacterised protein [Metamycoplasma cloacale]
MVLGSYFLKQYIARKPKKNIVNDYIYIKLNGAILNDCEIKVKKNTTLLNVLKDIKLDSNAYLVDLNLNQKLTKNEEIWIPFNPNKKIELSKIRDINFFINFGFNKTVATEIMKLYDKLKTRIKWSDIENINGIGVKNITKLKNILII